MMSLFRKYKYLDLLLYTIDDLSNINCNENFDFWVTVDGKTYTGTAFTTESINSLMSMSDNSRYIFASRGAIIFKNYEIDTILKGLYELYENDLFDVFLIYSETT